MVEYGLLKEVAGNPQGGKTMQEQPTFADLDYQHKRRRTRREEFLEVWIP